MAEFKPSFIPKKPIIARSPEQRSGTAMGLLNFLALILFFSSLTIAGGLFLYGALLERTVEEVGRSVDRAKEIVEPSLITELTRLDSRISVTNTLLEGHTVLVPVFRLLEATTLPSVRFEQLQYIIDKEKKETRLLLSGEAKDYTSLALQSGVFGENIHVKEPLFSNLRLNARGNVQFDLSAIIGEQLILYRENLE